MMLRCLIALLTLGALVLAAPASATPGAIQPGDQLVGGGTLSFVFDGVGEHAGKVYITTAAHIVDEGESVGSLPYENFGTVVLRGTPGVHEKDWAFIEVKPEFHQYVKAAVKGHPEYPTGIATKQDTFAGDLLQFSGYGAFFQMTPTTQEQRVGVLLAHEPTFVRFVGPGTPGDSGGPIVHVESGKALSLHFGPGLGPTYDSILSQAAERGLTVMLRTVESDSGAGGAERDVPNSTASTRAAYPDAEAAKEMPVGALGNALAVVLIALLPRSRRWCRRN